MKTESLLKALTLAKPALGANDAILPILSNFVFLVDIVFAYNDVVAIIVDEKTNLECALHGDTLLGILAACGEDVEIRLTDQGAEIKSGGWVKLPTMSAADATFELPDEEPIVRLPITPDILMGLNRCMISVGEDSLKPEFAGVTVQVSRTDVTFYSSDNKTATRYRPQGKFLSRGQTAAVLPAQAVARLLKLAEVTEPGTTLAIGAKAAVASFPGVTLVSRLLPAKPEIFEGVFAGHIDDATAIFEVPTGLDGELAKACVVLGRDLVKECFLTFVPGKMAIDANGTLGRVGAAIKHGGDAGLPASVNIDPTLITRVLAGAGWMAVNDGRSLVLGSGEEYAHIISSGRPKPTPVTAPTGPAAKFADLEDDIPF